MSGDPDEAGDRCPRCEGLPPYHTRTCMFYEHGFADGCSGEHIEAMREAMRDRMHPASAAFHELLTVAGQTHDRKQEDYGSDDDPFANVRASSEWGMPAWVGAMVRATDKVRRLQTFARKGALANESAEDAFMDLAVYALIALVLYREESDGADAPAT